MTTIHADSVERAFEQVVLLVLEGGATLQREDILSYVRTTTDLVLQLSRDDWGRHVSGLWVNRMEAGGADGTRSGRSGSQQCGSGAFYLIGGSKFAFQDFADLVAGQLVDDAQVSETLRFSNALVGIFQHLRRRCSWADDECHWCFTPSG